MTTIIGPDDTEFELPERAPATLGLVSYNVFLRPAPINALDVNRCRAQRIGEWLSHTNVDIVALQETFESKSSTALADRASERLPWQVVSQPPPRHPLGTSGGLSIFSRWPVEEVRTLTYDTCQGSYSDCVASKGAVHAVVRISEDDRVNVVATHLDAGRSDANQQARADQLAQLELFLAEIDPAVGPTVALGDFNIDSLAEDGEFESLVDTLDLYTEDPFERPSTVNCKTNILCDAPPAPQRLDYVFEEPDEHRLWRRRTQHLPMVDDECPRARYLSDHRAVWTTFDTNF